MRRNVFGTTPESTSPTIVSLNDQKISATHSLADLNLCATIQKKSKVYCVLFFKLTCRIIYARLYSDRSNSMQSGPTDQKHVSLGRSPVYTCLEQPFVRWKNHDKCEGNDRENQRGAGDPEHRMIEPP